MVYIDYGKVEDLEDILKVDEHITRRKLEDKLKAGELILAKNLDNSVLGFLRFNYFWDEIPFMNMLFVKEGYRNQSIAKRLVGYWEDEMLKNGHELLMTSTLSNESAQNFYRKLNYRDCGSLLLEGEALEIIFKKRLITNRI